MLENTGDLTFDDSFERDHGSLLDKHSAVFELIFVFFKTSSGISSMFEVSKCARTMCFSLSNQNNES